MKHLKLFFALFAMLALGVGNAWGADYSIKFLTAASDGSTEITTSTKTSTVLETASCDYVTGFTSNCTKAYYKGKSGVKLSSSKAAGTIELTLSSTCNQNISKVVFKTVKYSSDVSTLTFYAGSSTLGTIAAGSDFSHTFTTPQSVSTLKIASTKRAYISEIIISVSSSEPSTPAKTYDVTWMVNGEEWAISEDVEENTQITTLPTEPTDECAGKVFQGWTDKEITDGQKPAVLFKDKSPEITDGLTTFYAVFATIPAGGGTGGSITISSETENFPTAYGTANAFTEYTLEGYKFKIQQVYINGTKLQWRASGNSNGTGTMYNTQKFPANIASIVVVFDASDNNKNHTIKVGATENPTNGTSITPSKSGSTYTFDCSDGSYDYFVLTNGTNAGYVSSITINYGSVATPSDYTTSCSGSTEPVVLLIPKNGYFEGLLSVQLLALFLQQKDSFSATLQVPPCTRW